MRIAYFYNEEWEKDYISARLPNQEVDFIAGRLQLPVPSDAISAEVLSIFVDSHVGAEEMSAFPNLKLIVARSTGYDHIDLVEATKRGIAVCNVPSYGENTVAEFAFALLLALSRKICEAHEQIIETGKFTTASLRGFDLKGKTIGIVGTGRIGKHMIKMAKGFELEVLAFDPFPKKELETELGFQYVTLAELLAKSDIISLHAPYSQETHHLINLDNIGKIKKGACLINTARGGLVDTTAIVKGLQDGNLIGAGLDVLEEENFLLDEMQLLTAPHPAEESLKTLLENHYLINHPRVIITPHNAFNTKEALERILNTTVEDIKAFADGKAINVVQ